ncbi:MAG TPA: tetratricopeptide repeat protein [Gemmatimonadaceae bacterium]|nr:tetratricopeptide repeat protein [Gemmatimonadaceae bacterium]
MHTLHLLGGARIEGPTGRMGGAVAQRHRLALLAYLAIARGHTAPREKLFTLLWPEQGDKQARHLLNVAVHAIRKALGDDVLHTDGGEIRLDPTQLTSDVAAFREARAARQLRAAIDAWGGPFLEGFFLDGAPQFDQWQTIERETLARELNEVLHDCAEVAERDQDWRAAVACWRRLAELSGDRPSITLRLMRALDAHGDRPAAIQAADAHAELMRREYGAEPNADVMRLAARLRADPTRLPRTSVPVVVLDAIPAAQGNAEASMVPGPPMRLEPTVGTLAPGTKGVRRVRRFAAVLATTAVIVVAAITLSGGAEVDQASVAVLPFLDLSPQKNQAHISDGLTEELLNALAKIRGLSVASRSSSFQFRSPGVDIRNVGRSLGVAAVVEGSVRQDGDRLRVTAQLIDAKNGFHLWSEQYDRSMADVFAIQEEIARDVASALSAELVRGLPDTLVARATLLPQAYELYLKGRHEWNRRSREGILKATESFERAVQLDPRYAAAWAGLADAYQLLPDYADVPAAEGLAQAKAAALRAIALDSTLAAAHAALGALLDDYDRDRPGSERAYRTAIALNPGYATARQWLAIHLADDGRFDEAIAEIERARRGDPLSQIINTAAGAVRYFARDYDAAIAEYRSVLRENASFTIARALMGRVLLIDGRAEEAVVELHRSVLESGGDPSYRAVYAAALAATGKTDSARTIAASVEATEGYVPFTELASAYIYLGDSSKALSLFERAFEQRDPAVKHMKVEPLYDRIRDHPRFQAVLRKAGHVRK